jgi:hypothetical protein
MFLSSWRGLEGKCLGGNYVLQSLLGTGGFGAVFLAESLGEMAIVMAYVMEHERQRGWTPEDVSQLQDGSGFDIRSVGPMDDATQISPVRRIEVKGRAAVGQAVSLTKNEWQKLEDSYWLYVVWSCNTANLTVDYHSSFGSKFG